MNELEKIKANLRTYLFNENFIKKQKAEEINYRCRNCAFSSDFTGNYCYCTKQQNRVLMKEKELCYKFRKNKKEKK